MGCRSVGRLNHTRHGKKKMPATVWFIDKKTGKEIDFITLDERICAHVGDEVHPNDYCRNWKNCVALWLAIGKSYDHIENMHREDGVWDDWLGPVVEYMRDNYDANKHTSIGRFA